MSDIESTLKLNRETSCINGTVLNCLKLRETVNKVTVLFPNYVSETTALGFPFVSLFIWHIFGIQIPITCCGFNDNVGVYLYLETLGIPVDISVGVRCGVYLTTTGRWYLLGFIHIPTTQNHEPPLLIL